MSFKILDKVNLNYTSQITIIKKNILEIVNTLILFNLHDEFE